MEKPVSKQPLNLNLLNEFIRHDWLQAESNWIPSYKGAPLSPLGPWSPTLSNVSSSSYSFSSHSQIQLQARPLQSLIHIFIFYFSCVYLEFLTFPSFGPDLGWEIYWGERGGGRALNIFVRREEVLFFFLTSLPTHCVCGSRPSALSSGQEGLEERVWRTCMCVTEYWYFPCSLGLDSL